MPLKQHASQANNAASQQLKFLTPGVDGAIEGRLKGKRFVVTGVFPEICGGFGLTIGREKLKAMIEMAKSQLQYPARRITSSLAMSLEKSGWKENP